MIALAVALAVTAILAVLARRYNGRFTAKQAAVDRVSSGDLGAPLGERATLVQFSSAFCAPCRATRVLLTDVVRGIDGVETVEVDAESHLDLVRRLNVLRTPTVLVLDASGVVTARASGLPRRGQVLAALGTAAPSE